jgi:hypothetical protein
MRMVLGLLLVSTGLAQAGQGGSRFGIAPDLKTYPQGTPKEALASVLKAIDAKRFDYLVAQLADPAFIDEQVKRNNGGRFADQVEDTRSRLDPGAVKLLRRFLSDGDWLEGDPEVCVRLKDVPDRCLYLRKLDGRWYLENRNKPKKQGTGDLRLGAEKSGG